MTLVLSEYLMQFNHGQFPALIKHLGRKKIRAIVMFSEVFPFKIR